MLDFEGRLRNELTELGFVWDRDGIVLIPPLPNQNDTTAHCTVPIKQVNDKKELIVGSLVFDFGISLKESQEKSIIDSMGARLERSNLSTEKPTILMRQTFSSNWGILPSRQCISSRACDYLLKAKMILKSDVSTEERLRSEVEYLGYDYEKMIRLPSSSNAMCLGNVISLEQISHTKDQLVTIFHVSLDKDQNASSIERMTASLRRETPEGDICLMHEVHFSEFETLPLMQHLYDRATVMLLSMKVQKKFSITTDNNRLSNSQTQSNQMRRSS